MHPTVEHTKQYTAADNTIVLKAQHINKYFYEPQKFKVLKDISLTVNKGEFLSLVVSQAAESLRCYMYSLPWIPIMKVHWR
jgi:ABC-type polysaccharide/polyol phosphate transport system ATPase subunit